MKYDYANLKGKIKERYKTQGEFAKQINISERSLSLKLNNKTGFKQGEIKKICEVLDINEIQISYYFFKPFR